jgi:hypothetical protein
MRRVIMLFVLVQISLVDFGQIIADHTIVDQYDKIPQQYIDAVKKMWLSYAGESHSMGIRNGLLALEAAYPAYAVSVIEGGIPEAYTTINLRASRATWGDVDYSTGWIYSYGEEDWYTSSTAISRTKAGITHCHDISLEYSAFGFGWCWDPAETDMTNYLNATQQYIDYCTTNAYYTKVFFTTGPVDDVNASGQTGYLKSLAYETIRNYVKANSSRILFDFADILCYDTPSGSPNTTTWNGHTYPIITTTNLTPTIADFHISNAGALRLAKAMWWMLARMAGWDGGYFWQGASGTSFANTANWVSGVVPPDGSDISFAASPTYNCVLDRDRTLHDITIPQGSKFLVLNGHQLTLTGNLTFSGGAKLNASAGRMLYAGTLSQTIESGQFLNHEVYDLTVNNSNGVTLNTDIIVNNSLVINSGSLIVAASRLLTVSGNLTNNVGNSGLQLRSDDTGDGKLINNNSSVYGTVALYLTGNYALAGPIYHYFVPPVQSITIGSTIEDVQNNLIFSNFHGDLLAYDETVAWIDQKDGWKYFDGINYGNNDLPEPFSTLESLKGYNIYLTNNDIITFKGELNATAHSFNLNFTSGCYSPGWNLIGNPYPCSIDLQGVSELALELADDIDNSVYFTRDGDYISRNVYTGANTGWESDIIPPMQGFFVHVNSVGKSITLPVSSKTANISPSRAKGEESGKKGSIKKIKLVLSNGLVSDATVVCLLDKATDNFDSDYDAYKLFGNSNMSYIYTELGNIKYAINSLKEPVLAPVVIPVSVLIKKQDAYRIDITEFENLEGLKVILKNGAIETRLLKDATYQFTSGPGTFTNLQLIISKATSGVEYPSAETIKMWHCNNFFSIDCPADISAGKASLIIYDISGKIVYNNNLQIIPGQMISMPLTLPAGLFITRIILNNRKYVSKFVVY